MKRILSFIGKLLLIFGVGYIVADIIARDSYVFDIKPILYIVAGIVLVIIFHTKKIPIEELEYDEDDEDTDLADGLENFNVSGSGRNSYDLSSGYERMSGYDGVWRNPCGSCTAENGMMYDSPGAAAAATHSSRVGMTNAKGFNLFIFMLWPAAYDPVGFVCQLLYSYWGISTPLWAVLLISCTIATCFYFWVARRTILDFVNYRKRSKAFMKKLSRKTKRRLISFGFGFIIWGLLFTYGCFTIIGVDVVHYWIDQQWGKDFQDGRGAEITASEMVIRAAPQEDSEILKKVSKDGTPDPSSLETVTKEWIWIVGEYNASSESTESGWLLVGHRVETSFQAVIITRGWIKTDSVSYDNEKPILQLQPVTAVIDYAAVHRHKSEKSLLMCTLKTSYLTVAVGEISDKWIKVYSVVPNNTDGSLSAHWGYIKTELVTRD